MYFRQEQHATYHGFRVSRYGAHTSLSMAERIEIIDLLQDHLFSALDTLAHVRLGQQKLHYVSFIAVQQLFHSIADATLDYAEFITQRIRDLGGFSHSAALMSTLHSVCDTQKTQRFGACIQAIHQGAGQLHELGTRFGFYRDRAIGGKDDASTRFIEACERRTVCFIAMIKDNLPSGTTP